MAEDFEGAGRAARLLARANSAVIAAFTVSLHEHGWSLRGGVQGVHDQVKLACEAGHEAFAAPVAVLGAGLTGAMINYRRNLGAGDFVTSQSFGPCERCEHARKLELARAAFPQYLADFDLRLIGDTPDERDWVTGQMRPSGKKLVRCLAGHVFRVDETDPRMLRVKDAGQEVFGRVIGAYDPNDHPCDTCKKIRDTPKLAAFKANAADQGVMIVDVMDGLLKQELTICCMAGHLTPTTPGKGATAATLCMKCRTTTGHSQGRTRILTAPTVYYVVAGTDARTGEDTVKPGISSGDGRGRLYTHARDGLDARHMLVTDLPTDLVRPLERFVLDRLKADGWKQTRGDEYFPVAALPDALAIAGDWMAEELVALPAKYGPWLASHVRASRPSAPAADPMALLDFAA